MITCKQISQNLHYPIKPIRLYYFVFFCVHYTINIGLLQSTVFTFIQLFRSFINDSFIFIHKFNYSAVSKFGVIYIESFYNLTTIAGSLGQNATSLRQRKSYILWFTNSLFYCDIIRLYRGFACRILYDYHNIVGRLSSGLDGSCCLSDVFKLC